MNTWVEPLTLFVQDRAAFNEKYADEPRTISLCNKMFLVTESRPQVAEHIAVTIMGHEICHEKKYDGMIVNNGQIARYSEYKVTCRRLQEDGKYSSMSSIQINDVSESIVARYVADQPLFVFPYFLDGHLAAMFSVDFAVIEPKYTNFLATNTKVGRPSFSLALSDWLSHATVEFVHKDPEVVEQLAPMLRSKIYQSNPSLDRSNINMTGIVKFPEGHEFERFGFNFDTNRVISYARSVEGLERADNSSIKVNNIRYSSKDIKLAAAALVDPELAKFTVTPTRRATPQVTSGKMTVTLSQEFSVTTSMAEIIRQLTANIKSAKFEVKLH